MSCDRGHDVTALVNAHAGGGDSKEVVDGVCVVRRKPWVTVSNQPVAPRLFDGIDLSNFDLVHFHAPNPFANALLLPLLARAKVRPALVITHHMDIRGRLGLREMSRALYARLVRAAQLVIVTSIKNANLSRDLPKTETMLAVPLGVEPEHYVLNAEGKARAAAWRKDLAGDAPLIGFLGRHARYKGLDVLVRAIAQMPGVHAAIAGDGPYRQSAEALAAKLGVADRIHFLGKVDHGTKLSLLSSIDVYTFPSTEITEAFGISQLEAMFCGAPVVASALPTGVTDVSIDGRTALTCRPSDAADLAEKVQTLLNDRVLAERLAQSARAHVMASMTSAAIEAQTRNAIEAAMIKGLV
ncbi:glycosyltransferase [Caulobacter sp. UC70_42]|uniref:glycosyltransferase n=1 Tax=Caulobacter sp. UC70_42 TaxID=3374551 RepID=UPI00375741A7